MLNSGGIYAVKKRKKPVQKSPKPRPVDGVKSNPSKRHRDRLNCELDKLTGLLPFNEDVRGRLDKLSVLRLTVAYLKVKNFFGASMKKKRSSWLVEKTEGFRSNRICDSAIFPEGDLLLQALNGFILVVTAEGFVFYASTTIQDYLGFQQSDVVHQSVFELIHTDDRPKFHRQLHWALNPPDFSESNLLGDESSASSCNMITYDPHRLPPENSSFMERSFICRFRCLLDNSSGFLTLSFQGRLKFLHGQNKKADDGSPIPPQLALFVVGTPLQSPSILEIRTKTLIFQTKHKLDFTPMACDTKGKFVLGYTDSELCMRGTGYQFIHAADMIYCADNHVRMIKTGETGMTIFRLLTKQSNWIWVQANARLVYKGGQPDCIIARQRALTNEEGEEHLQKRTMQLPFNFATGEAVLYENDLFTSGLRDLFQAKGKGVKIKNTSLGMNGVDSNSLLGAILSQSGSIYVSQADSHSNPSLSNTLENDIEVFGLQDNCWQSASNGVTAPKQKSHLDQDDSLSALMDILSQKNDDEKELCNTLQNLDVDVENMELEQWEETLLKMDIDPNLPDDLDDIISNDFLLSYVEDMLATKDGPSVGGFHQGRLDSGDKRLSGTPQQNWFVPTENRLGFNPQKAMGPSCQTSIAHGAQNPMMGQQNAMLSGHQTSMMSGSQAIIIPDLQTPVSSCLQTPVPPNLQTPIEPRLQNPTTCDLQNGLCHPICLHTPMTHGLRNPTMYRDQGQVMPSLPTGMMLGSQDSMVVAPLNSMMGGQQNQMSLRLQGSTEARPLNSTEPRGHNPLGSWTDSQNLLAHSPYNSLHISQNRARPALQHTAPLAPPQQVLSDDPRRPWHLAKGQARLHSAANLQPTQLQHMPIWQNRQPVATKPLQGQDCWQPHIAQTSCSSAQELLSTASQGNKPCLQYGCSMASPHSAMAGQPQTGQCPSASNSFQLPSCKYMSSTPLPRNGLSFPDTSPIAALPPCSKMKQSSDHSPLQAFCYVEKNHINPSLHPSLLPNDEVNTQQSSCQYETGFPFTTESACGIATGPGSWDYSGQ